MIVYVVLISVLFYFFIASLEDIKKREVYDYINYSLVLLIIIIGLFDSYNIQSLLPLKYIGFGILAGFGLGSILYYLGIWGGGDAKFLIGFGAASYYLKELVSTKLIFENLNFFFIKNLQTLFQDFFNYFLVAILFLNVLFMIYLCINFLTSEHNKKEKKNIFNLFLLLFFLNFGLSLNLDVIYLILIGIITFLLLFFADEYLFFSVYYKIKKFSSDLIEGEILDKSINFNKVKKIEFESQKFGLRKDQVELIKLNLEKSDKLSIRKYLPYSLLIGINFILYLFKIINLDKINLEILGFLLKFLFISFIVGGILTILILIYLGIKHHKKIKVKISKEIKYLLFLFTLLIILISLFIDKRFSILLLFIILYLFIKYTKELEKIGFVKKKELEKISLGDWIAEDIIADKKIIYQVSDFKLGVDEFQLKKIKELSKHHKNLHKLLVKDGIAFLPPLFLGFIIMILL